MSHVRPVFDVLLPPKDIIAVSAEAPVPEEPTWQGIQYQITGQVEAHDGGSWRIYTIYELERGKAYKTARRLCNTVRYMKSEWFYEAVVTSIEAKGLSLRGEEFRFEVPGEG